MCYLLAAWKLMFDEYMEVLTEYLSFALVDLRLSIHISGFGVQTVQYLGIYTLLRESLTIAWKVTASQAK